VNFDHRFYTVIDRTAELDGQTVVPWKSELLAQYCPRKAQPACLHPVHDIGVGDVRTLVDAWEIR